MKIYLANSSQQAIGGGFTFLSNFRKAMGDEITEDYNEAEVYFIASPSMVSREEVLEAKELKKKIVLRIDNAVRNSRNRNTGMTRMKDFAEWADLVVYQSNWARKYLLPFTKRDGVVIHNSVDTSIFNFYNRSNPDHYVYLYGRYNRDETKNWEVARYYYSQIAQKKDRTAELWLFGQFSPELVDGNFDFYADERIKFWGVQQMENMVNLYTSSHFLLYTYFNDACPNTLIEAMCCGVKPVGYSFFMETGGAPEIISRFEEPFSQEEGLKYFGLDRMANQYRHALRDL